MGATLGGSMFIRNAVEYDYCVSEALASLCAVADSVVVTDCSSTDDTLDMLLDCATNHPNLIVIHDLPWEISEKSDRLRAQADIAKSYLKTDWHLMLQADEVIHERSFPTIRALVDNDKGWRSFLCRRFNLYGDLNHYVGFDILPHTKPMSDQVIRLATIDYGAYGDAESLRVDPTSCESAYCDSIIIYHYGLVRRDSNHLDKIIDMQSWFFGTGEGILHVDKRVIDMKERGAPFEWHRMHGPDHLRKLPYPHPRFSAKWAEERQAEKVALGVDVESFAAKG